MSAAEWLAVKKFSETVVDLDIMLGLSTGHLCLSSKLNGFYLFLFQNFVQSREEKLSLKN